MSEPKTLLRGRGLAKRYQLFFEKPSLIRSVIPILTGQGTSREFRALEGIDFAVAAGECLGIVGANGSGKSTLLRIIAGVTTPTSGTMTVRGVISSLLELGSGFHPELTGRENTFLNGSLLGLTRKEIEARFGRIVEFSGLHEFINARIYTYSAGMTVRLGFAIAIHVPFDILVIDEIIAVGDLSFQEKCFREIERFRAAGKTIVVVSHSMEVIRKLCTRALWLHHGKLAGAGTPGEIVARFSAASKEME